MSARGVEESKVMDMLNHYLVCKVKRPIGSADVKRPKLHETLPKIKSAVETKKMFIDVNVMERSQGPHLE